ncbi:hypothetical protein HNP46_006738 [Pseudomonas nitritireducens]|uniref:Uncharacterized protein n=1 Tax=Pseudomonas nitroreducens TaxID=46680 RepID=A0A7W7KSJ6_PSENT|nr:hypothetical protein [Pseudomonas nitritireducens]MBB4867819.1 hypothetical protein [Pseudomonas nitritireducens]
MTNTLSKEQIELERYGFTVGSTVQHIKDPQPGIVTEIDSDQDLGDVTTCRVVWGAESLQDALDTPRPDQDLLFTNKLVAA